jgi:hypothetical protein
MSVTARAAAEAEDGEAAASSSNPGFVTAIPSAAAAAMYNTGFLAAVAAMAAPRSSNTGFVTAAQSVGVAMASAGLDAPMVATAAPVSNSPGTMTARHPDMSEGDPDSQEAGGSSSSGVVLKNHMPTYNDDYQ